MSSEEQFMCLFCHKLFQGDVAWKEHLQSHEHISVLVWRVREPGAQAAEE